jgi:hypothetical protein
VSSNLTPSATKFEALDCSPYQGCLYKALLQMSSTVRQYEASSQEASAFQILKNKKRIPIPQMHPCRYPAHHQTDSVYSDTGHRFSSSITKPTMLPAPPVSPALFNESILASDGNTATSTAVIPGRRGQACE